MKAYLHVSQAESDAIEAIIDRVGLNELLLGIGEICCAKADHVLSAWQDERLEKRWLKARTMIDNLACRAELELP